MANKIIQLKDGSDNLYPNLIAIKNATIELGTVPANDIVTVDHSVSSNPAVYGFVVGFIIQSSTNLVPLRINATSKTTISVRVRNVANSPTSGANIVVYYI